MTVADNPFAKQKKHFAFHRQQILFLTSLFVCCSCTLGRERGIRGNKTHNFFSKTLRDDKSFRCKKKMQPALYFTIAARLHLYGSKGQGGKSLQLRIDFCLMAALITNKTTAIEQAF